MNRNLPIVPGPAANRRTQLPAPRITLPWPVRLILP